MNTIKAWLQLQHTPGIGSRSCHQLSKHFSSIDAIMHASEKQLAQCQLKQNIIDAILATWQDHSRDSGIQQDLDWLQSNSQHHIITLQDERYPLRLRQISDAPAVLYVRGDPDYLSQPQLAIVGSRNPSAAGLNSARDFARHLASAGITITSGLANGIDGAAHRGALQGIAGTVALVAHGLDIVYPAVHQQLAQEISQAGAVVSEVPIGTEPARGLFPRRNRIISGLSIGTLVVEAALKSGSLLTAKLALEQNKELFAIPGSIHNPLARGCHQLIRQGAKLVETADDILEELGNHLKIPFSGTEKAENPEKINADQQLALDPDHQKLLKCLSYEPLSIDELVQRSVFSAAEIASMLLIMELEGSIVSKDGRYTRVI
ncbi:MAG TPA: DNA-protecting protein DprA [Gammaproteobacteria bacterium]|nr:DNA-protecting protein DprA [Gammaproteobacteria bacterium]